MENFNLFADKIKKAHAEMNIMEVCKEFELDNHLGNVIATVSDRKIQYVRCKVFNGNPIGPTDPTDNNNFRRAALYIGSRECLFRGLRLELV